MTDVALNPVDRARRKHEVILKVMVDVLDEHVRLPERIEAEVASQKAVAVETVEVDLLEAGEGVANVPPEVILVGDAGDAVPLPQELLLAPLQRGQRVADARLVRGEPAV